MVFRLNCLGQFATYSLFFYFDVDCFLYKLFYVMFFMFSVFFWGAGGGGSFCKRGEVRQEWFLLRPHIPGFASP